MRLNHIAIALMLLASPAYAQAPAANAAAPEHYTTTDTPVGDILDDPAAKAVLDKYAPQVSKGDQIDQGRGMTLASMQQYAPDILTDKVLAEIDTAFAKLPVKK
jgi:hypothetical protein